MMSEKAIECALMRVFSLISDVPSTLFRARSKRPSTLSV